MTLTILGLGPGHIDDLTRRAWRTLENAETIYLRTHWHPCVPHLPNADRTQSFDSVYEQTTRFEDVYKTIVARVLEAAAQGDLVYAVPGDPLVAESTVTALLKQAPEQGIKVEVVSGVSFIEPTLALLGIDALNGLQLLDALTVGQMHHPPLNPDTPALLGQVYSRPAASEVKLTLMNQYPDDFQVALVHAAGTDEGGVEWLPLYEIDHSERINHLTSLYVPALGGMSSFEQFQEIIAHLRAPEGCPWDKEQTHKSLRRYLLEETHEVLEALDADDPDALREELGDLLLQIVLHTQIATEFGEFQMTDVLRNVNQKMIVRHPHVWSDVQVTGSDDVVTNWEALKKKEQAEKGKVRESALDGVPVSLPALMQAHEYQRKAAKPGFDWDKIEDVIAKVHEEIDEVLAEDDPEKRAAEMGDLLFALVNWSRWLDVEPETALREANAKFMRRFRFVETSLAEQGKALTDSSLVEMDDLWNQAKRQGL